MTPAWLRLGVVRFVRSQGRRRDHPLSPGQYTLDFRRASRAGTGAGVFVVFIEEARWGLINKITAGREERRAGQAQDPNHNSPAIRHAAIPFALSTMTFQGEWLSVHCSRRAVAHGNPISPDALLSCPAA
ncbi:MAG: hypothetical protein WD894_22580 [Pirellulales bacterium]